MNNGCICCTVRGDLIRILGSLMKRQDKFDAILIETTGLADPGPWRRPSSSTRTCSDKTRLDGIVTVVDAKYSRDRLKDAPEAKDQIAFADVILLNKTDLVHAEELDEVEAASARSTPSHAAQTQRAATCRSTPCSAATPSTSTASSTRARLPRGRTTTSTTTIT